MPGQPSLQDWAFMSEGGEHLQTVQLDAPPEPGQRFAIYNDHDEESESWQCVEVHPLSSSATFRK